MLNNSLQDIIQTNIDISNATASETTFDNVLLIVPAPTSTGTKTFTSTIEITSAEELLAYGYTSESDAYIASKTFFDNCVSQKDFISNSKPLKLFLYKRKTTTSDETTTNEAIATALNTAMQECDFYGFHLTSFRTTTDIEGAIAWAEANEKLYGFEYTDLSSAPTDDTTSFRTFGVFSGNADGYASNSQPKANEFVALAMMAKCFSYHSGSETWAMKELTGIVPSKLTSTEKTSLANSNINTFLRYAGKNITIGGKTLAGEWIDVIRFRDWLKSKMQENVFNVMQPNAKIPFTDKGIGLIQGAMEATLLQGQEVGGVAQTETVNGEAVRGYTITVPSALELTEVQRNSRTLPNCRYTARLVGAIHLVEIQGVLTM